MVELLSTNPARTFGLYPRKGTIAVGSDADLVIFNPDEPTTISAATGQSNADYSLFEGVKVVGVPETVMVRGQVIVHADRLVASAGTGRFVRRALAGHSL